jgi:hypothetical protein
VSAAVRHASFAIVCRHVPALIRCKGYKTFTERHDERTLSVACALADGLAIWGLEMKTLVSAAHLLAATVRVPLYAVLRAVEPVITTLAALTAVLGLLIVVLFSASGAAPNFSRGLVLGISVGCALIVPLIHGMLRWLSR